jgi:hypothetical protein
MMKAILATILLATSLQAYALDTGTKLIGEDHATQKDIQELKSHGYEMISTTDANWLCTDAKSIAADVPNFEKFFIEIASTYIIKMPHRDQDKPVTTEEIRHWLKYNYKFINCDVVFTLLNFAHFVNQKFFRLLVNKYHVPLNTINMRGQSELDNIKQSIFSRLSPHPDIQQSMVNAFISLHKLVRLISRDGFTNEITGEFHPPQYKDGEHAKYACELNSTCVYDRGGYNLIDED